MAARVCRSYDGGMPIPDNITREHVLAGLADFEAGVPHTFGPSIHRRRASFESFKALRQRVSSKGRRLASY